MRRFVAVWVAVAFVSIGARGAEAPQAPAIPSLAERIEAYLAPAVADGHLSGTLLVAKDGQVLFERAWGMADYELKVPNTPRTRHCVASVTKPMTIALICQLAEEQKLRPEDTIDKWFPGFPRGDRITVSQLLNHRAGIAHRVTTAEQESRPLSAAEMVELVQGAELMFEPGEKSVYSSAGYAVLARIIELVDGRPYGQALATRLFERAGMRESMHPQFPQLVPDRAKSYAPAVSGVVNVEPKDLSFLVGAGSVFSTAGDLHRMIAALLDGRLGEAAKLALLRDNGVRWNGITNGYRAFADYYAPEGVEIIFTGNLHTGAIDRLRRDLPRLIGGEEVATPARIVVHPVDVAPEILRRYEGEYESEFGSRFSIHERWGLAYAGDRMLVPTSTTTFYSLQDYGEVRVVFDDSGGIERLDWEWNGEFLPWRRIGDATD